MESYNKEELIQLYEASSNRLLPSKEDLFQEVWDLMKKAASKKTTKIIWRIPEKCLDFCDDEECSGKIYFFIRTELEKIGVFKECRLEENDDRFGLYSTIRISWDHFELKHFFVVKK